MKPPKILIEASTTAKRPISFEVVISSGPAASKAPTMITDGHRVGHRHQRRMQSRRHPPHHVITDEAGENENRQAGDEEAVAAFHAALQGEALRLRRKGFGEIGQLLLIGRQSAEAG